MAEALIAFQNALKNHEELAEEFLSAAVSSGFNDLIRHADAWRSTVAEISRSLINCLEEFDGLDRVETDSLSVYRLPVDLGTTIARRYKKRGLLFDRFLESINLLKTVFIDAFHESASSSSDAGRFCLETVHFFFDRLGIAASISWIREETSHYHKRLREANHFILQEKRRYFTIFNRMNEPAFVVDENIRLVDANPAFEKFFGVKAKDHVGKTCCEIVGGQVCSACGLEKAMQKKTSFSNIEAEIRVRDQMRTVLFAGTFLGDINGVHVGGIVILQDITEKKRYERMLLESEEKYRSLVENVPDVTWRIDGDGTFVFISPNIETICGYAAAEIMRAGRSGWYEKVHPDDVSTVKNEFGQLFAGNKRVDLRYRLQRKDGSWIWMHDRSGAVYEKDGKLHADGVLSDITELKRVEEELERHHFRLAELVDERTVELRKANEELTREVTERQHIEEELMQLAARLKCSNDELEQFAHVASHDLKEPLLLIVAFCERLTRHYGDELDDRGCEYLCRITRTAKRMQQLIDDLLQLSRVTTSKQPIETIDLNELLHEVIQHLEEHIHRVRGKVQIHSPHTVHGDRMQVWQLFQNIITNALKFRKESIDPLIIVTSRIIGNDLCEITVEDNGIGFDERFLERIFNPFERLHGRDKYEGTGIGLATCKKIVVKHGGEITARSVPGQGSTFIVRLPLWQTKKRMRKATDSED